jgi:hypothetical protein
VLSAGAGAAIAALGVVAAQRAGVLDDGLRGIGIEPHPEPDPGDVRLLTTAAQDAQSMLNLVAVASAASTLSDDERRFLVTARAVIAEQARSLGVRAQDVGTAGASVAGLAAVVASTADRRAHDAVRAVSSEVAQVLAAMAAGLDQLVLAWRRSE